MGQHKDDKKIVWHIMAFMAFSTVWGFGNVINGFSEYGGLKAIVSWILIFAIYFVPYALMVGELGSAFKDAGGGVSSWINETIGPKMAYYAGWTYWIVHMPYISQKPNSTVIAASWALFQDKRASGMNTTVMQILCLFIFLFAMYLSGRGIRVLKRLAALAGSAMFIMSLLFILMMAGAPFLTEGGLLPVKWSLSSFIPDFNGGFFLSLSILVFAVGGCEKISPYVNKMQDPSRNFAKGMAALAVMVAVTAILGTIALGMMFDSSHIPGDLMTNGAYYAFQKLGEYYHTGNFFVIIYALTNLTGQFSVMVLSVDAPLRMLLDSADSRYIPGRMFETNDRGVYVNGHRLVTLIVCVLIIVPAFGIKNVDVLVRWLVKVNSVCMPLRYLWVFAAYMALKKAGDSFHAEYRFLKGRRSGMAAGLWCFLFTAFACLTGIYSEDPFQLALNIATPFVLVGLGFIMPRLAAGEKKSGEKKS